MILVFCFYKKKEGGGGMETEIEPGNPHKISSQPSTKY